MLMDFLYSSENEKNNIILLLVVARGPLTYAVYYIWDFTKGVRQTQPKPITTKLPDFCRLPNLLIPLTKSSNYLLITPSFIVYNLSPTSSKARKQRCSDLVSNSPSVWAKWARPYRHSKYDTLHDDVFLCREDGRLTYVDIDNKGQIRLINMIGQLDCEVDAAFDTIDFNHPSHGGDLLIAGGSTGHGGLFIQIARQNPECVQRFVNWAPIFDTVVVPPLQKKSGHEVDTTKDSSDDPHLYVSSTSSNNTGAVYEFRYGYEAQIGMIIPLEDFTSAQVVWVIPDFSQDGIYFLISDPVSSALMHLSRNENDESDEIYAVDGSDLYLDLSVQSLAAGSTSTGVLLQVTPNAVRSVLLNNSELNCVTEFPVEQTVLVATVNGELGLVAAALRSEQKEMSIQVGRAILSEEFLNFAFTRKAVQLEHEPICIMVEALKDETYIFVGTSDGCIVFYRLERDEILCVGEYTLNMPQDHISKAIESMALVDWTGTERAALYCGLRSGLLIPLEITFNPMSQTPNATHRHRYDLSNVRLGVNQRNETRFGQTVLKLLRKESTVLVTCGLGFWRISDISMCNASDFDLHRIWITDQNDVSDCLVLGLYMS